MNSPRRSSAGRKELNIRKDIPLLLSINVSRRVRRENRVLMKTTLSKIDAPTIPTVLFPDEKGCSAKDDVKEKEIIDT